MANSKLSNTDTAKLELWERMARAIIRAYVKLPMSQHNVKLNQELSELRERCQELEPALTTYYPMD